LYLFVLFSVELELSLSLNRSACFISYEKKLPFLLLF
jgi:hypothetical protein